jgi:phospholipase C
MTRKATLVKPSRGLMTVLGAAIPAAAVLDLPAANSPPAAAQASPIQHVVVIYLENHSFDNLLGFWCDAHVGRCPDGGMPSSVTLSDGTAVTPATAPGKIPHVKHTVQAQQNAIDGGKMDGRQHVGGCSRATGYACIAGYQPSQVPVLAALAGKFAISDNTFELAGSPSWGGHLYAVAGTQDGFSGNNPGGGNGPGWGCDSNDVTGWNSPSGVVPEPSCIPDYSLPAGQYPYGGAFEQTPVPQVPSIMDRLDAAGLSWRIYGATAGQGGYIWSACPTFASCLDTGQDANLVPSLGFQADATAGSLPAFSLVTPGGTTFRDSCHNGMSITACDNWIGSLVQAAENGPDWDSTAIFITFDDCGCFYDQVPPPSSLDASGQQAGVRVPLLIVSPYAKPQDTDSTPATFASILAYTEHTFGLAPLSAADAQAYDFSGAFDYLQAPLRPARMVQRPLPDWARHLKPTRAMLDDPS